LAMRSGQLGEGEWRCARWTTVNDNADPNDLDPAGFTWTQLDRRMERVVLPLRQKIASRGEELYLNLTYVAFVRQCSDIPYLHDDDPAEYAEFILAAFQHIQSKFGVVPDGVEVILEPDNTPWTGTMIGEAIAKTGALLEANGFHPDFIGPSNTNMTTAVSFFDQMVAALKANNALQYLTEFSYHRYSGVSAYRVDQIADRAQQYGLRTAMLEKTKGDYLMLHEDLKVGNVSSWQQFALAFTGTGEGGNAYFGIDFNAAVPRVTYPQRTKLLRQYFRYIRPGAQRIGALTTASNFDPVAFINANQEYVVVVSAKAGGTFSVANLPAGDYGVTYATDAAFDVAAPDVTLATGQALSATIPAAGVLTVYGK
ncbi:MAG: hypothetical protein ACRELX_19115, partial [Longimicrobiales bacterium]